MTDLRRFDDEMNYGFCLHSIRSREQNGRVLANDPPVVKSW